MSFKTQYKKLFHYRDFLASEKKLKANVTAFKDYSSLSSILAELEKESTVSTVVGTFDDYLQEKVVVRKGKELQAIASATVRAADTSCLLSDDQIAAKITFFEKSLRITTTIENLYSSENAYLYDISLFAADLSKVLDSFLFFYSYVSRFCKAAKKDGVSVVKSIELDAINPYIDAGIENTSFSISLANLMPRLEKISTVEGKKTVSCLSRWKKSDFQKLNHDLPTNYSTIKDAVSSGKFRVEVAYTQRDHSKGFKKTGSVISDVFICGIGYIAIIVYGFDTDGFLRLGIIDGYGRIATLLNFIENEDTIEDSCPNMPVLADVCYANFSNEVRQKFLERKISFSFYFGKNAMSFDVAAFWQRFLILKLNIPDVALKPSMLLNLYENIQIHLDTLNQFKVEPHLATDMIYYAREGKLLREGHDRYADYVSCFSGISNPTEIGRDFSGDFTPEKNTITLFMQRVVDCKKEFFDDAIGYTSLLPLLFFVYLKQGQPVDFANQFTGFRETLQDQGITIDLAKANAVLGIDKKIKDLVVSYSDFFTSSQTTAQSKQFKRMATIVSYVSPAVKVE